MIFEKLHSLKLRATNLLKKEDGAVAFEYVLILGGVSAVIIGLLFGTVPGLFANVLAYTCTQVQLIVPLACA